MTINRHNYEVFMIDYLEGNLSEALRLEMDTFLLTNPDISEEADGLIDVELELDMEDYSFDSKEELKNLTDLLKQPSEAFEQWEKNMPRLPKDHIVYPHKSRLRRSNLVAMYRWSFAVAACMALVLTSVFIFRANFKQDDIIAAEHISTPKEQQTDSKTINSDIEITSIEPVELASAEVQLPALTNTKQVEISQTPVLAVSSVNEEDIKTTFIDEPIESVRSSNSIQPINVLKPELNHLASIDILPQTEIKTDEEIFFEDDYLNNSRIREELTKQSNLASTRFFEGINSIFHHIGRSFYKRKTDLSLLLAQVEK